MRILNSITHKWLINFKTRYWSINLPFNKKILSQHLLFNIPNINFRTVQFLKSSIFKNRLYLNTRQKKIFLTHLSDKNLLQAQLNEVIQLDGSGVIEMTHKINSTKFLNIKTYIVFFNGSYKRIQLKKISRNCGVAFNKKHQAFCFLYEIQGSGYLTKPEIHLNIKQRSDFFQIPKELQKDLSVKIDSPLISSLETNQQINLGAANKNTILKWISNLDDPKLPKTNLSQINDTLPVKIGLISDSFMSECLKDAFEVCINLTPDNYKLSDEQHKFDAVIYTTPWSGLNDEWRYSSKDGTPENLALTRLIKYFQSKGKPVIFISKEDPSNFDRFIKIALMSDYVFTMCEESLEDYRAAGVENCELSTWPINTRFTNPLNINQPKINAFLFAGSYFSKYPARAADANLIFDKIIQSGNDLIILDRNSSLKREDYSFPKKYMKFVYPSLHREELLNLHKKIRFNINLNSINNSNTMMALRVVEFQAMGVNILSNYSNALINQYPHIPLVNSASTFNQEEISSWETPYLTRIHNAETVLENNNSYEIARKILVKSGFSNLKKPKRPSVTLIVEDSQVGAKIGNSENSSEPFRLETAPRKDFLSAPEKYDTEYFMFCKNESDIPDDFMPYRNAMRYSDTDYIFMNNSNDQSLDYTIVQDQKIPPKSLISKLAINSNQYLSKKNDLDLCLSGIMLPKPAKQNDLVSSFYTNLQQEELALSIIIPIHNNGNFLRDLCLPSIKKDLSYKDFEIILVDDASTCIDTKNILDTMSKLPNFEVISLPKNSGSASRPRNIGIKSAKSKFIAVVDPDNALSLNCYSTCLKALESNPTSEFAFGGTIKINSSKESITTAKFKTTKFIEHNDIGKIELAIISEPRSHLEKLKVIGYQACVFKKSFILDNNITFKEGTIGQDTLFCWELLSYAKECIFIENAFVFYYSEIAGSVTNIKSSKNFYRRLELENHIKTFLSKNNLMNTYIEKRLPSYIQNVYYKLIKNSDKSEYEKHFNFCKKEISRLYNFDIKYDDFLAHLDEKKY